MAMEAIEQLRLLLREPDFATASRLATAINQRFGLDLAWAEDAVGVRLNPPPSLAGDPVSLLAIVQEVEVEPDTTARIVINVRMPMGKSWAPKPGSSGSTKISVVAGANTATTASIIMPAMASLRADRSITAVPHVIQ